MKYSLSIPTKELVCKIYGYKSGNFIYWESKCGVWYFMDLDDGRPSQASSGNNYSDINRFTPIYEPFSINIGS